MEYLFENLDSLPVYLGHYFNTVIFLCMSMCAQTNNSEKKSKYESTFKDSRSCVLASTNFTNGCPLISIANPNYMAKQFLIIKVISYSKKACPLLLMYLIVTYENDVYVKIILFLFFCRIMCT